MSVEENLRLMDTVMEAHNAHDWGGFSTNFAESVVVYDPTVSEPIRGREALREFVASLATAFPDIRWEKSRSFGEGDFVCFEANILGTHKGPLSGPGGQTITATDKTIRTPVSTVSKVEGGEITEVHVYYDVLGMMAQLGVTPQE